MPRAESEGFAADLAGRWCGRCRRMPSRGSGARALVFAVYAGVALVIAVSSRPRWARLAEEAAAAEEALATTKCAAGLETAAAGLARSLTQATAFYTAAIVFLALGAGLVGAGDAARAKPGAPANAAVRAALVLAEGGAAVSMGCAAALAASSGQWARSLAASGAAAKCADAAALASAADGAVLVVWSAATLGAASAANAARAAAFGP